MKSIYSNFLEDILKIFLPTVIIAFFYYQFKDNPNFLILLLGFTFFIDTGHVYTTYVETFLDKEENKKYIHYLVILIAYVLNYVIYNFFNSWFYFYIFYYTIFHNARQGMGVGLLYKKVEDTNYKNIYYFLTFIPFFLFHFLTPMKETIEIGQSIFKSLNFSEYADQSIMNNIVNTYYIMIVFFAFHIYKNKKNYQSYIVGYYFGILYSLSFLIIRDPVFAFSILVVSHSIPYVFLMSKRVHNTHSNEIIRKFSILFIMLFFIFGGALEYFYQDFLIGINDSYLKYIIPLFWTPTIGHFIIDSYIWKKSYKK